MQNRKSQYPLEKLQDVMENEEMFHFLLESISDVVWVLDLDSGRFIYVSPSVEQLRGYTPEEVLQQTMLDALTEESIRYLEQIRPQRLETFFSDPSRPDTYIDEVDQPCKDGSIVHTEVNSHYQINPKTGRLEVLGVSRDISRRKLVEKRVEEEREQFLALLNGIPEMVYVADFDTHEILFANRAVKETFGEEVLGKKCYEVIQQKDSPCEFCSNEIIRDREEVYTWEYYNPTVDRHYYLIDKKIEWYRDRETRFELAIDITDTKRAEQEIRKLSTAVEQNPASIVITDVHGNIEYVNPKFTERTGYSFAEAEGKNPRILKSGRTPQRLYRELWETILSGETWYGEFINRTKDGSDYYESAIIAPITDEEGTIVNFVAVKEDITKRKEAEHALLQSERELRDANSSKNKFFSIIAHDLRNPFNGLVGLTEMLLNGDSRSKDELHRFHRSLYETAKNTYELLDNLLQWSRSQSGTMKFEPATLPVGTLIDESLAHLQTNIRKKEIRLEKEVGEGLYVEADGEMIKTVLRNLISNALKFTPRGGHVRVSAEKRPGDGGERAGVLISVSDTGVGIPEEQVEKIFRIDESYSTEGTEAEKGSGLGLVLCREFVDRHGGEIRAQSTPGEGSSFYVYLDSGL